MASLASIFLLLLIFTSSFSNFSAERSSRKELKASKVTQLRDSVQSYIVDPSRVTQLLWRPRVFQYSGFLSDDECDHLISLGKGENEGILRINYDDRANVGKNRRLISSETSLKTDDSVLAIIDEKISAWTFLPKENGRPLYVRRYEHEETEQNLDYFGDKSILALSEPLMATVILYLSNVTRGGEIRFPDAEPKSETWSDCTKISDILKPIKGNAVLFFTTRLNGSPDSSSSHARCPVLEREMWCATKFFYLRAVPREKISIESEEADDCSDEDENCAEWAAMGECQRNPVFMVGSPDYYGSCRKSCNAC